MSVKIKEGGSNHMKGESSSWVAYFPIKTDRKNVLRLNANCTKKQIQVQKDPDSDKEEDFFVGIINPETEYWPYYKS